MKKCQDCRANHKNDFCELGYKTEILNQNWRGGIYEYISPLEKCDKPKTKKEYINRIMQITRCKDNL